MAETGWDSLQACLYVFVSTHRGLVNAGYHEKRLLHNLLDNYNVLERPVVNESDPLQLSFGLTLMQIIDVTAKIWVNFETVETLKMEKVKAAKNFETV
ncbi:conserved hypothetical protein [Culex quinquefasciatus]|uniref:Neurotransmitter-gated ion-channel ligand-binding domain-containing protein n=1 Tax=Culex quinquefasciatus TaxID=7176 RepID=B0XJX8_CULQU|nr:conserved hypothetical protein [Culex quinquefasciatus]|eukprot:XP_001869950.1 conserved hypothetical protein [Culex quinquefasciatus]